MQGHTRRLLSTASLPSPVPTSCSSRAPGKGSFVSRCCLLTPGQTPTPSLLPQISLQNTLPKSRVLGGAEFRCPAEWHPCLSSAARHRCWRSGPWDLRICRLPLDRLPPPLPPVGSHLGCADRALASCESGRSISHFDSAYGYNRCALQLVHIWLGWDSEFRSQKWPPRKQCGQCYACRLSQVQQQDGGLLQSGRRMLAI